MQLSWGARSSRPLPSASRRRAGHNHFVTPFSEWILPPRLFGETPNRATETVALPFSGPICGTMESHLRTNCAKTIYSPDPKQAISHQVMVLRCDGTSV